MISKCRNVEAAISAIKSMAKAWQKHGSRTFFRNVETESEEIPKSCQPRTYNVKHVFEQLLQEVYNQVQIRQIFNDQNIIREWFTCVTCDRNSCDFKLFYGLTWFDMVKSHTWRCLAVQQSFGTWMNIENAGFMNGKTAERGCHSIQRKLWGNYAQPFVTRTSWGFSGVKERQRAAPRTRWHPDPVWSLYSDLMTNEM